MARCCFYHGCTSLSHDTAQLYCCAVIVSAYFRLKQFQLQPTLNVTRNSWQGGGGNNVGGLISILMIASQMVLKFKTNGYLRALMSLLLQMKKHLMYTSMTKLNISQNNSSGKHYVIVILSLLKIDSTSQKFMVKQHEQVVCIHSTMR